MKIKKKMEKATFWKTKINFFQSDSKFKWQKLFLLLNVAGFSDNDGKLNVIDCGQNLIIHLSRFTEVSGEFNVG